MHAYPVPEIALIGGKIISNLILSLILVLVGAATAMVYQVTHGGGPVDLHPFLTLYGGILFPTLLLLTTLSVCLAYLAGSKPGGYALLLGAVGALVWAFIRGHRHWLYNLPAAGLFAYSDLVGLGPLRSAVFLHRLYVTALALFLFFAAVALYPRAAGGGGRGAVAARLPGGRAWRERRVLAPALAAFAAAVALGGVLYARVENGEGGMGALATERLRARYEKEVKPWLAGRAEPELAGVDLELDLYPGKHSFAVAAGVRLRNTRRAPIDIVHLTVNPRLLARGTMTIDGRAPDRFDCAVATFVLPRPLEPGEEARLAFRWRGAIPDGLPRSSSALDTFIEPGGSYLHSFAPWPWLPVVGYSSDLEIESDRTRRKRGLPKRDTLPVDDGAGITPGFYHQSFAYPYRARIRVPDGEEVLSAGTRVARRDLGGGRVEFEYASDGPIYFFPVMAGRWVEARDGSTAVYHAAVHPQNARKILAALAASRAAFSDLFSPYPYRELRIAEFPRLATFAMGYPTLIPFSEAIGFLTRDPKKRTNLNFYVTAHEVAHQWWGTVVWPAHAKGSPVLTEGLANYASLLMAEREEGEEKRQKLFEDYEDRYLRRRDANEERPLVLVDGDRRRDEVLWYDRGGVVLYMLHRLLGEERMLAGLKEYIRRFSFQEDHPTMTDFIALYEGLYPETAPFFDQFVEGKAIPNPGYARVAMEKLGDGAWRVGFEIANRGSGDLDLVVAANAGERGKEGWREARTGVALRGASPVAGEIRCDFKPERIEMDPDRTILLQERRQGRRELE
jgi:ABC-2 type transport system permease protein